MNCTRCGKPLDEDEPRCLHCGEPSRDRSGLYQTSTVLISSGGRDGVYRSLGEVPARLRSKLLRFTNGRNSATILIADCRGRREIAKALRGLPGAAYRSQPAGAPAAPPRLSLRRKRMILAGLVLLILAILETVFRHWN